MGHLWKRGNVWWCKYYVNGKPIRESTGTRKRGEAKTFLEIREGDRAKGLPVSLRIDRIMYQDLRADLIDHYKTTGRRKLSDAEGRLRPLDQFFGRYRAAGIGPTQLTAYIKQRQGQGLANSSINRELSVLRKMLRLAWKNNKLHRCPSFEMLREPPARKGFLEPEMWAAIKRHLPVDLAAACRISYMFGWRMRSEVLTLRRSQLDLNAGTLRLHPGETKNREGRVIYLTADIKASLAEQIERVDQLMKRTGRVIPWVFPHLHGRFEGQPRRDFVRAWKTACKNAGCPWLLKHDFRRSAVRNLIRAGVPDTVAMKLTGHQTRSVFDRYAIVNDGDLQAAAERLGHSLGTVDNPPARKLASRL